MASHEIHNEVNESGNFFCCLSENYLAGLKNARMVEEPPQQLPLNFRVVYCNAPYPLREVEGLDAWRESFMKFHGGPKCEYCPLFLKVDFY
mmetsp:Transcript_15738/g.29809  ORF Transcript_15738/g.29809 Transcript_15738/m.29809 type:complete len:91 (+) Transcript_15738:698-970(+)